MLASEVMKNSILFFAGITLASLLSSCSQTPKALLKESIPFVGSLEVDRFVLNNGLKVLVVEDHTSPTFAYQTWFNVGSKNEKVGYTGLAHLFEHMMFKQTKTLKSGEFMKILEQEGAEGTNAFTSRDYTAYIQEVPREKLELVARLESERMVNLMVDQKAFKTETEVVQNERRYRNENSPEGMMYQTLFETAYSQHPYRWPVIGYQEDLDRMSSKDAYEFYQKHYRPNQAVIVIVGDVDSSKALEVIKKYYEKIPSESAENSSIPQEPDQTTVKKKKLKLNIQVEKLLLGYRVPGVLDSEAAALEVLQGLLSEGKSSRLSRALVETGISNDVGSGSFQNKDPTLFIISTTLQKGKRAATAEGIIRKELKRVSSEPISERELKKAKNLMTFSFYNGLSSQSSKANFLGRYETIAGDFRIGLKIQQSIANVTSSDIRRVTTKYFQDHNRTVIIGTKK